MGAVVDITVVDSAAEDSMAVAAEDSTAVDLEVEASTEVGEAVMAVVDVSQLN